MFCYPRMSQFWRRHDRYFACEQFPLALDFGKKLEFSECHERSCAHFIYCILAPTHADGSLIATASPANPGEVVILYLVGLGASGVPVADAAASPAEPLAMVQVAPTLTVNSASAVVFFAGLTPGSAALYQINFQVPAGAPDRDLPPAVSQGGVLANAVSLAVHH